MKTLHVEFSPLVTYEKNFRLTEAQYREYLEAIENGRTDEYMKRLLFGMRFDNSYWDNATWGTCGDDSICDIMRWRINE